MTTRAEHPIRFRPMGVYDTLSGDNSSSGACEVLQDLIPDPSTPACFVCRPANTTAIDFSTWASAPGTVGPVTVMYQVNGIVYGLVGITTGTYAGKDYPFACDASSGAFLTVSGITTNNVPTSQATTGDWIPPQMTLMSIKLVTAHIGFDGATHFFGVFDVTTPTSPVWSSGNTSTNALPSVPSAAQVFSNRTYFVCKNVVYYTDTLALAMANSNQSFTIGDYTPITAFAQLPVSTTSQGIVQGLLAFKTNSVTLITGDAVTSNLSTNLLSPSVGTTASRTVVPTPEGVVFMAVDGIRVISFAGQVSEPNKDLATPFINALTPSRACASFNSDTYRICIQNGAVNATPYQDYWYTMKSKLWTGPHTFEYGMACPNGNDFLLVSNNRVGKIYNSFVVQGHNGAGVGFVEDGVPLSWRLLTSPMTDLGNMYANSLTRSTIEMATPASGQSYNFTAQDENGTALARGNIAIAANQSIWGAFIWGLGKWGASTSGLTPLTIPWDQAVVFSRLKVLGTGASALGLRISSLHLGYKPLKYILN